MKNWYTFFLILCVPYTVKADDSYLMMRADCVPELNYFSVTTQKLNEALPYRENSDFMLHLKKRRGLVDMRGEFSYSCQLAEQVITVEGYTPGYTEGACGAAPIPKVSIFVGQMQVVQELPLASHCHIPTPYVEFFSFNGKNKYFSNDRYEMKIKSGDDSALLNGAEKNQLTIDAVANDLFLLDEDKFRCLAHMGLSQSKPFIILNKDNYTRLCENE